MQMLIVTRSFPPHAGGAEKQLRLLSTALSNRGHSVTVLTGHRRSDLPSRELARGLTILRLPDPPIRVIGTVVFLWHVFFSMFRLRQQFDVVLTSMVNETEFVAGLAASLLGKPRVLRFGIVSWNMEWARRRPFGALYRWSAEKADAFSGQTQAYANDMFRYSLDPERLTVIPNAVIAGQGARRPVTTEQICLLWCGRLTKQKNPLAMCDVADRLQQEMAAFSVKMVGDGQARLAVEESIRARRLEGMIQLAGETDDILPYLQEADIFCLTSLDEGMPNVILEAMASGVPVVATAVGGVPEMIKTGQTGILVPPGDVEAMAEAIKRLADNPEERRRLAEAAYAYVKENHNPDKIAAQYEELFMTLRNQPIRSSSKSQEIS